MTLNHPNIPGITVKFVTVTPTVAGQILARNEHNRTTRPRAVAAYVRDMTAGSFLFNGDTICIAGNGVLLDGQHRLQAVIDSEISQVMLVVTGLDYATQSTMDSGVARIFGDHLKLQGEVNANVLAALARKITLWNLGSRTFDTNVKLTHAELAMTVEEHPELRASADIAARHKSIRMGRSVIAMAHWLFASLSEEQAQWFVGRVNDGVNLPARHPALLLRERLMRDSEKRVRYTDAEQLALAIQAWNAYRDGRLNGTHVKIPADLNSASMPWPR